MHSQSQRCRLSKTTLVGLAVLALLVGFFSVRHLEAGGKKSDSEVKIAAVASKVDASGNQLVSITLDINKGWHAYANPVGNADLRPSQTVVKFAKVSPENVKIAYPEGKLHEDKILGDYKVYEGRVNIKAAVRRAAGDAGPLEVAITIQVCNEKTCLLPATVKLAVK